ncbi:MAG: glutathione S-transferase family protein [Alphaproteobacteria bacterium]|nr:glutathione S-transferase family protein [Alphaproteobacteria bacterium]
MPSVTLFELKPTRSARVRWALQEAGLPFESVGNSIEVFKSEALRRVHPLGKLPAVLIDGKPLFESAAIVTAIADLVPEKALVAAPGSWARNLHYQWMSYALNEIDPYLHSSEINTIDFILPKEQHVPAIVAQNTMMLKRAAAVLNEVLERSDYLVDGRFSATDIVVGYTICWCEEQRWLGEFPKLVAYLERLRKRPHCTLPKH